MMRYERPIVWSVAGYDPTGGAGVLADAKTFEQHGVLGMAFLSATTIQTEDEFMSVNWNSAASIIEQMAPMIDKYAVSAMKIGIVERPETLLELIAFVKSVHPSCKMVWDPVLSASSGFEFHDQIDKSVLQELLKALYLITPNVGEARKLAGMEDEIEAAFALGEWCSVLLKGGHSSVRLGVDVLIENQRLQEIIGKERQILITPKHGSGCILSSAIAAQLALGENLADACRKAKHYTEDRLISNSNLLAYHAQ